VSDAPKLAYSLAELQEVLGVGRATARRIAEDLGIRVSPRRILVPAVRLECWLEGRGEPGRESS
jgi:hypothetical protein